MFTINDLDHLVLTLPVSLPSGYIVSYIGFSLAHIIIIGEIQDGNFSATKDRIF